VAVGIWSIRWIAGQIVNFENIPKGIDNAVALILFIGVVLYFIGFWKAVKSKIIDPFFESA
jgi:hypothetical protein